MEIELEIKKKLINSNAWTTSYRLSQSPITRMDVLFDN